MHNTDYMSKLIYTWRSSGLWKSDSDFSDLEFSKGSCKSKSEKELHLLELIGMGVGDARV